MIRNTQHQIPYPVPLHRDYTLPTGRKWDIFNANGYYRDLFISDIDFFGNIQGNLSGYHLKGKWDEKLKKITFTTVNITSEGLNYYNFTGFLFNDTDNPWLHTLTGFYELNIYHKSIGHFGWYAKTQKR
ncbi:hypothetical protein [Neobacillus cucumis]|uniref:hypothetical protein n=1 Tax=Neobacillus cucumis TaxID=1740721 RepID=UPI002E1D935E|nr:hypothetical protein [Neobacillus cucumis]